ncbi:hypothetical protein K2173_026872 [Erythroxylum novogranatense]|uniref:CHHC U11-48K-type domain-containing protein n=1 Tax=Erythroxylum novogranatense TaxID=1862640 RepID=A0AAV8TZV7_9ROSI|nr:hypothetical protein K2173_026872 [Erythroxylum novogranatense]
MNPPPATPVPNSLPFRNPNSFSHHHPPPLQFPYHPPRPTTTTIPTSSTQIPHLSTTLSSITDLLSLSHQTLTALSSLTKPQITTGYVSCPHNPHHLMPPESLFLHSLRCPFPLSEDPASLIQSLYYPKTLNNPLCLPECPLKEHPCSTEVCFSLDAYHDEFAPAFFYKDCPGVVNFNDLVRPRRLFTLPRVLLVECANSARTSKGDIGELDTSSINLFPSDFWGIRREIDGWVDYPIEYLHGVFCTVLGLHLVKDSDLRRWIITDSPRHGVLIDVYMRDHISLLFGLSLRAIRREALALSNCEVNMTTKTFKCPVLVLSLTWIVSQLSVLYGEMNAKCFVISIFRQCILDVACQLLLFPLVSNSQVYPSALDANQDDGKEIKITEGLEVITNCKYGKGVDAFMLKEEISVPRVAGAVAAVHERSLLEAKIKELRGSYSLPRYHRVAEHVCISQRADEERKKRDNYRAVIEHDGLLRKQTSNQDSNKAKTKEELLAEERDYKRRRMSYRGKKLKRTTLQVMRDIIDEYMEDIMQAGGIGCFGKGDEHKGKSSEPIFIHDDTMDVNELRKNNSNSDEATRTESALKDVPSRDYGFVQQGNDEYHEHLGTQTRKHGKRYHSGSPGRRSHSWTHNRSSYNRERDALEYLRVEHPENRIYNRSNHHVDKSLKSVPDSTNYVNSEKDDKKLVIRNRDYRNSTQSRRSNLPAENAFEDRYDPMRSLDMQEEDVREHVIAG